jgi:hypothetical protein
VLSQSLLAAELELSLDETDLIAEEEEVDMKYE